MASTRTSPISLLKLSADVASFYGFRPAREVERRVQETSKENRPWQKRSASAHTFASTAALTTACISLRPQEPVLAFYATPSPSHVPYGLQAQGTGEFGLQIVGSAESVGEIILFKTLAAILAEWGAPIVRVRVNALGDRDSRERFARELSFHARKHAPRLTPEEAALVQKTPALVHHLQSEAGRAAASEAPRSINFLSEKSRVHFRSVLEHLEQLGFAYELDDSLLGDERPHHIAFAIDLANEDATILAAMGGRYDDYFRGHVRRGGSVGVGASIFFRKKGATHATFTVRIAAHKPKIYFAQLGLRAKLQGLSVLEMLRRAGIPVEQSFDAVHLGSQLAQAQAQGVSHLLIMGQREALDGTVIVRTMRNSAQSTMQLSDMPRFLKTLR